MIMKSTNTTQTTRTNSSAKWAFGLAVATFLSMGAIAAMQQATHAAEIVVYKSPTCGCCKEWVKHLKKNGYEVEVHNKNNVAPIKRELGVPRQLQSCHTAKIDGYVIEGHVPADLITKLRSEKPQISGLAVPGMPMGSPGMEGPRKDAYDIIAFDKGGKTSVFASR